MKKLTATLITLTAIGVAVKEIRYRRVVRNLSLLADASERILKNKPSIKILEH